MSDKELMRESRYQEALGTKFNTTPFYLINNTDPYNPVCYQPIHSEVEQVERQARSLGIELFIVGNDNADWL